MKNFYFFFSLILFISCSKNEPENSNVDPLPSEMIITRSNGTLYNSYSFQYDNNKLVNISFTNSDSEDAGNTELLYTDNLLLKINRYDRNDILQEYTELLYDSNSRLEKFTSYRMNQNEAFKNVLSYNTDKNITQTAYSGDFDSQTELVGETFFTLDSNSNFIKVKTANYQIDYEYDSENNVFKNLIAREVLNIIGKLNGLNGPLNRGGMNNVTSYEWSNDSLSDHIDLNYKYNSKSYPTSRTEFNPEFGEGLNTEYKYN